MSGWPSGQAVMVGAGANPEFFAKERLNVFQNSYFQLWVIVIVHFVYYFRELLEFLSRNFTCNIPYIFTVKNLFRLIQPFLSKLK